jgi:hypothetical protein
VDPWTRAGAAALCGRPDGPPLAAPERLLPTLTASTATIEALSTRLGTAVTLDAATLLTERAAISGFRRRGATSCGGASRLLPTAGGWIAVSLPRADDLDLLPAWLGVTATDRDDALDRVGDAVAGATPVDVTARGQELGLAVSTVGAVTAEERRPVVSIGGGDAAPLGSLDGIVVIDLTSLWAGPLCTRILADAGATVIKVESTRRPDGARFGPAAFFDLMNAGKRSVALDLASDAGRADLRHLVSRADIVVEASRPRALAALGVTPKLAFQQRPRLWVSITGYGRTGPGASLVAFGDDAAAAGGAVLHDDHGPLFCADALGDPVTGLFAAASTLDALAAGGRWILDVSMSSACATVAPLPGEHAAPAPEPEPLRRPPRRGSAADLGADTRDVLDRIGR